MLIITSLIVVVAIIVCFLWLIIKAIVAAICFPGVTLVVILHSIFKKKKK